MQTGTGLDLSFKLPQTTVVLVIVLVVHLIGLGIASA